MFHHMLTREREVFWKYGEVTCAAFSLKDMDTVKTEYFLLYVVSLCCGSILTLVHFSFPFVLVYGTCYNLKA